MNYDEAIEYIETVSCSGIMPGLVRIQALLEKTEHPEKKCNVIHVAGTNGKGSVCSYISSILMKAGYRVGRYVSPTLLITENGYRLMTAGFPKRIRLIG